MSQDAQPLQYASNDLPERRNPRRPRRLYCISLAMIGLAFGWGVSHHDNEIVSVVLATGGWLLGMVLPLNNGSSQEHR